MRVFLSFFFFSFSAKFLGTIIDSRHFTHVRSRKTRGNEIVEEMLGRSNFLLELKVIYTRAGGQ